MTIQDLIDYLSELNGDQKSAYIISGTILTDEEVYYLSPGNVKNG